LRAKTIHNNTYMNNRKSNGLCKSFTPIKNPINANGKANTVCANFTRDKYWLIFLNKINAMINYI
jgi:hypothetical protein